jgi:molybdate transport system ATP-binding protein
MLEASFKKSLGKFVLRSSFKADKGIMGIIGSSGCGKSMTLKCLAGIHKPDSGTITLNGKVLFCHEGKVNIPPRNRKIGYVFQNYALFPHMTVHQNVSYGITGTRKNTGSKEVAEMIERMQLSGLEKLFPSQLSGGQQQRTALARTLIIKPDLLLLDEPFSALDSHIKYLLEKELVSIIKKNYEGIVLLVTHNIDEAYRICDNIMIIDEGHNLQIGGKDEIISSPANLAAARITGCKNFLDVTVLSESDDCLTLQSNGIIFKASKRNAKAHSSAMIAGIRAHHIELLPIGTRVENTYPFELLEKIESVFSTTIIVKCAECILQIEISKTSCPHITENSCRMLKLHIPADRVFLVENT